MRRKNSENNTDEIVSLAISYIRNVQDLQELEEQLGQDLTPELLKEISKKLISMKKSGVNRRKGLINSGDKQAVLEQALQLSDLKYIDKKFRTMRQNGLEQAVEESSDRSTTKKLDYQDKLILDMEMLDYWIVGAEDLLQEFQSANTPEEKIRVLKKLEEIYETNYQDTQNYYKETIDRIVQLVSQDSGVSAKQLDSMRKLREQLETPEYHPFQEKINLLSTELKKNTKMLDRIRKLKALNRKKEKEIEIDETPTEEQEFIEPSNKFEQEYQRIIKKVLYGKYVEEYGQKLSYIIPEEIEKLIKRMNDLPRKKLEELSILAEDVIKQKRKQIKIGISEELDTEKYFLKRIEEEFKNMRSIPFQYDENTEAYYDILSKLMEDDRNYDYIKNLLTIEEFRRARKTQVIREGKGRNHTKRVSKEHIVLLALDKFIENYKLKLVNQGLEYVEPTYYKKIIELFQKYHIDLLPEEAKKYNKKLERFTSYVIRKGYHNKKDVLRDISDIEDPTQQSSQVNEMASSSQEAEKTTDQLNQKQKRYLAKYALSQGAKKARQRNYPGYYPSSHVSTFQLESLDPFLFSISYQNDGSRKMGVHILDTTHIINENEAFKKDLEEGKLSLPKIRRRVSYPTMSFESIIEKDFSLSKGIITPAVIKVDKYYTQEDMDNYRNIPDLKELISYLHLINEKIITDENMYQELGMKEMITTYLSEAISTYFEEKQVPFIYRSKIPSQEELIQANHNEVCNDLYKIPKPIAHQIFYIMDSREVASDYYIAWKTANNQIELNPATEEGIYLLDTLRKIKEEKYNPDEAQESVSSLLDELNSAKEYVPSCLATQNNKRLDKMIKSYKKEMKQAQG